MIKIDKEKCNGCGLCVNECVFSGIIEIKDKKATVVKDKCIKCGHCIAVCPQGAVSTDEYDMNEVLEFSKQPALDSEDLLNAIKCRRSVRHFETRKVERNKLEKIIEAGRFTPTACNKQNVRYIVVENNIPELENEALKGIKRLFNFLRPLNVFLKLPINFKKAKVKEGFLFYGAPALILTVSEDTENAAISAANMELMASSLGLGAVYVGFFTKEANKNEKLREMLGLKKNENAVMCLAIGYPSVKFFRSAPRKKADIQWL